MPFASLAAAPGIRSLTDHRRTPRPHLFVVPAGDPGPRPPEPPAAAELGRLLTGVLEVLDGRRSPGQLAGLLPCRYQRALLANALAAGPGPRRLRSVHLNRTTKDAVDLCARVEHGGRSRAMTGRLARHGDRWVFSLLELV